MSASGARESVFVLGWEPFNADFLDTVRHRERYRFLPALSYAEAVDPPYDIDALLATAERRIAESGHAPDAIVGYWDFPTSMLAPLLRRRFGLPGPTLEAVLRCEHKYWSRLEQARLVPDMTPEVRAVDPFDPGAEAAFDLGFPVWLKPVKAHSSHLGFRVHDRDELARALAAIRARIDVFGDPFDAVLRRAELPPEVARVGGSWCVAEAIISRGRQCTLEGYALDGRVEVYGAIDSIREGKHRSCFGRYQYPSRLPRRVLARMAAAARRVITGVGFDNGAFNVEFYWDERDDRISLLEINARISKSHCPLFVLVDGASHQQVMSEVALGRVPDFPQGEGPFGLAAKFMLRHYADGTVTRAPTRAEIARARARFPEMHLNVSVEEGQRLRHLQFQDSYSFELAQLFLGAEDQAALLRKFRACRALLPFEVRDRMPECAAAGE